MPCQGSTPGSSTQPPPPNRAQLHASHYEVEVCATSEEIGIHREPSPPFPPLPITDTSATRPVSGCRSKGTPSFVRNSSASFSFSPRSATRTFLAARLRCPRAVDGIRKKATVTANMHFNVVAVIGFQLCPRLLTVSERRVPLIDHLIAIIVIMDERVEVVAYLHATGSR